MNSISTALTAAFLIYTYVSPTGAAQFKPIAVVELFTSEGCSSCPPADKLVAEKALKAGDNIFILSFHVDYWNRLGWKDSFSRPEFSERQEQYSDKLHLESVYTPQIVVNGQYELVGSDESKLNESIQQAVQSKTEASFTKLNARLQNNEITVDYALQGKFDKSEINFALIGLRESTAVKAGENRGRRLNHVNVVRQLIQTAATSSGKVVFKNLPSDAPNNLAVVAFVQQNDLKIIGAAQVGVN